MNTPKRLAAQPVKKSMEPTRRLHNGMNKALLYLILLLAGWLRCGVAEGQWSRDAEKCAKASGSDETIAACTRAITSRQLSSTNLAITLSNRGIAWANKGDYDRAIADFKEAIWLSPQYAPAYNNRGNAWNFKRDYDQAIADYDEAIRLSPQYATAYTNRGSAWDSKGDYDRAIVDHSEAIRLNPQEVSAYINRGSAWDSKGDYDRAIADFNEAIRLSPQYALAYNNRGSAWNSKGDYARAIADFSEAIRLDPQDALAYSNRGLAFRLKGDFDRAIADYNEAIRLNPKYPQAYLNRGVTRFAQGQFESAGADLSQALRLNPNDPSFVIWRYFAQSRADYRTAAAPELVTNAAKVDKANWPAPIIDLLAGTTDAAGVLKAVTNSNQKKQREQMCVAAFFLGEWHLLQGHRSEAHSSLKRAERDCPKNFLEYFSASAELKRLSP